MITPVCQSFGASSFHAIPLSSNVLHFLFNAIKISGRISSSPAAFSGFQFLYGCCHFCHCEYFLFPKLNQIAYVSVGNALTGFNKSSKYSLHGEGIYFSSLGMFPVKYLMEIVVLETFSMQAANGLPQYYVCQ